MEEGESEEDGWRVLDHLVLDPSTRNTPVIIQSGAHASIEARRAALTPQHPIRVLPKPYDLDRLLAILAELVPEGRGGARQTDSVRSAKSLALAQPGIQALTPRQREVAVLIAKGCTNRQIAQHLVLEAGTVANHVEHILQRLGLVNRAQVAAWAVTSGLLSDGRAPDGPTSSVASWMHVA